MITKKNLAAALLWSVGDTQIPIPQFFIFYILLKKYSLSEPSQMAAVLGVIII